MRIEVLKVLSLQNDGACCNILNIGDDVKIVLDCGISHDFNFDRYRKHREDI